MIQTNNKKRKLTPFRIMVLGFAGVILLGALLLMLPIATKDRVVTPFIDALFSSTTSVCVTGLVVRDTGTYWSLFGQMIILVLVQVGGLGVITIAASLAMLAGRKIGLFQRSTMQEAMAAPKVGGIVRLTTFILKGTFIIELLGAAALAPVFCRDFGPLKGIWYSIFHSVSAFCNAGLDLLGGYSSLTAYVANPLVNITVMLLIVMGGLGFLTWDDFVTHGIHIKKFRMQSKVILTVTAALIFIPAAGLFAFEFEDLPLGERIMASLFQAITPRTAGFNTVDIAKMSQPSQLTTIMLMLIGGSPGSTAGGMKITTFALVIAAAVAVFRRRDSAELFGRRIAGEAALTAGTFFFMYIVLMVSGAVIISAIEGFDIFTCMFETASAIGTVGLTLGITPALSSASKLVIMALMFFGRVGGLTLIYAAFAGTRTQLGKLPLEKITIG